MSQSLAPEKSKPRNLPPPGPHPRASTSKMQAIELQKLLMEDARNEEKGAVRAQIARAWVDVQEMRLRLAMKAPPKPIDTLLLKKQRKPKSNDSPFSDPSGT